MEFTKTLAFQIPEELFNRIKEHLDFSARSASAIPCIRYSTQGTATLFPSDLYLAESDAPGRSVQPGGYPCSNSLWSRKRISVLRFRSPSMQRYGRSRKRRAYP